MLAGEESGDLVTPSDRSPEFKVPLQGLTVSTGDTVLMKCTVDASPEPHFYWYANNRRIRPSRFVAIDDHKDGSTLQLKNITPFDSGKYTVRAINRAGVKSSTATLTVKGRHRPTGGGLTTNQSHQIHRQPTSGVQSRLHWR